MGKKAPGAPLEQANQGAELAIVWRPLAELIPYARNSRTHSDEQIAQLAASLREFGWTNPVLIDGEGGIVAGHGRVLAARQLGRSEAPTISLAHLTELQRRAYVIADNKLALNAGWDAALLRVELDDLRLKGWDVGLTGFSDAEILALTPKNPGRTDPDQVPPLPEEPQSRPGDVWILGRHRLACGDSTAPADVERLLAGAAPHLMVTDPPYGVSYDPSWRARALGSGAGGARGKVLNDNRADWTAAWALFAGAVAYVWHGDRQSSTMQAQLEACGFEVRAMIIWAKSRLVLGRGHYHSQHESAWYAVRKGATGHWQGDRKQTTLWAIETNQANETGHGTQKPVECMRRPIENNSAPGEGVYDPFMGSGTTLIAAEMAGRTCFGLELSPAYVDVSVRRWQEFTGETAHLEASGEPFGRSEALKAA